MNAVIRHIETDDVTQTNLLWQQPFGLQKKLSEERQNRREKRAMVDEELKVILTT